jgi:hypothetical protein
MLIPFGVMVSPINEIGNNSIDCHIMLFSFPPTNGSISVELGKQVLVKSYKTLDIDGEASILLTI